MRFQAVDNGDNCQRPRRAHQRAAVAFFQQGALRDSPAALIQVKIVFQAL
jgi:hypothetical protein